MSHEKRMYRLKRMYREENRNRRILLKLAESNPLSPVAKQLLKMAMQANLRAINTIETELLKCCLDNAAMVDMHDGEKLIHAKAPLNRRVKLPVKKFKFNSSIN